MFYYLFVNIREQSILYQLKILTKKCNVVINFNVKYLTFIMLFLFHKKKVLVCSIGHLQTQQNVFFAK